MRAVGLSACFMLSIAPAMYAQAAPAPAATPAGLHWGPAPAVFPKGATLIAVSAMGPFAMTYVNAADDPQKQVAKP